MPPLAQHAVTGHLLVLVSPSFVLSTHHNTLVEVLNTLDDDESRCDGSDEDEQGGHQEEEYFEVKSVKNWKNLNCQIFSLFPSQRKQRKLVHRFAATFLHIYSRILPSLHNTQVCTTMLETDSKGFTPHSLVCVCEPQDRCCLLVSPLEADQNWAV